MSTEKKIPAMAPPERLLEVAQSEPDPVVHWHLPLESQTPLPLQLAIGSQSLELEL